MKTVLIIEDSVTQLEMLRLLVLEVNQNAIVYTATETKAAYKIMLERTIDVFLVDIILDAMRPGDTSGVQLVEKLRMIPKYMFTPVVFITSLDDATKYTYTDLHCLGYVEKPFSPEKVKEIVKRALCFSTEKGNNSEKVFCFRREGVLYPVKVKNIIYIETINHIVSVYLADREPLLVPYRPCKQILADIDSNILMQCSRNVIVNKEYILNVDMTNRFITLKGVKNLIEVGITYKKKIMVEYGLVD